MYQIFKLFERFFKSSHTVIIGVREQNINVIKLIYTVNSEDHKFFGIFFWGGGCFRNFLTSDYTKCKLWGQRKVTLAGYLGHLQVSNVALRSVVNVLSGFIMNLWWNFTSFCLTIY